MKPLTAWGLLGALAAVNAAALLGPWPTVVALAVAAFFVLVEGRRGFLFFAATTVTVNTLLLAWLTGDRASLDPDGALLGAAGAARIVAVVGLNLAFFQTWTPARFLEGLRLPRRVTAFTAAVLIAAQDLGRDHRRIRDARRMDGDWPAGRIQRVLAAATLLPPLMVAAHRRAHVRRDALRLAGVSVGSRFAPVVAVTALGVAGRLALIAFPNISLTYVVVFAGGVAFGARVGFWGGLWSMALTDLFLSGLLPSAYANAPAMALVGLTGGLLHGRDLDRTGGARALAASMGILGTFLFSIVSDVLTWAMVAEFRTSMDLLRIRILAGLAFNAVPALTNAVLFAATVHPVARAFAALRTGSRPQGGQDVQGGP